MHILSISETKMEEFKQSTGADSTLTDLIKTVQEGWPENKAHILSGARPFWSFRDVITYNHGILFKGSRVIVSSSMCSYIRHILEQTYANAGHRTSSFGLT